MPELPDNIPHGNRLFQISEGDLASLERIVPELASLLTRPEQGNRERVGIREAKRILSDVRWEYMPYTEVENVDA